MRFESFAKGLAVTGTAALAAMAMPFLLASAPASAQATKELPAMQVYYLEVVTKEVDAVCAAYSAALGVQFGEPVPGLGKARTAALKGGGWVGVRAPLR